MKKKEGSYFSLWKKPKILLIMKLSIILMVIFTLQLSAATGFGQFSFTSEGKKVREVLDIIEKESNYRFFYNDEFESINKVINLNVENQDITQVLDRLLASSDYTYKVFENNLIVISLKENIRETTEFQQNIIKGTITDEKGNPLTGVSVIVKGTTRGTTSDLNGNYAIQDVNPQTTLVFSFIGFKNQEVLLGNRTQINITLIYETIGLDEVVVVGYGEQSRSKLTTSVSKLDPKVLTNSAISNAGSSLQGTVSGLRVITTTGQPGSSPSILLRGGASITSPGSPLVVVDGIVRTMNDVNPSDIESISVLKDAASTAIYGARANNGVILVSTKKGQSGKSELTYSLKTGVNIRREPYEYLNGREATYYIQMGAKNLHDPMRKAGLNPEDFLINVTQSDHFWDVRLINNSNRSQFQSRINEGWDWMANPYSDGADTIIFKDYSDQWGRLIWNNNARTQDHHLRFSGGNDKGKYIAGLGYYSEDGTVVGTKYERFSGLLNGSYKIKDNLEISSAVTFSNSKRPPLFEHENFAFIYHRKVCPWFNPQLPDGSPAPGPEDAYGNPLYWLEKRIRLNNARKTTFNLGAKWEIIKDLSLNANINIYYTDDKNETFDKSFKQQTATVPNVTRAASASYSEGLQQQHNITLDYKKSFNKHNLTIMAGGELFNVKYFSLYAAGRGAASDAIYTLNAAVERTSISSSKSESEMRSLFSRLNYDYNSKYLFTAVMRYDGTSVLSKSWGLFPGFSVGWNVHEEDFYKGSALNKYISALKPRISYGVNGNVAGIGTYEVQGGYSIQNLYYGAASYLNRGIINKSLRWEKSIMFEAGADVGLMNNKALLVLNYFRRTTADLLTSLPLPSYTGFGSVRTNLGNLQNTGFETEINANILQNANGLNWDFGFNASYVKNKILKLPDNGNENNRQGGIQVFDPKAGKLVWMGGYQEGQEFGDLFAYKHERVLRDWEDVNATVPNRFDNVAQTYGPVAWANLADKTGKLPIEPGDVLWADLDGNDTINTFDRVKIGNIFPKWTGGFSSTISYKNISLYGRFDFALGHTIFDQFSQYDLMGMNWFMNLTTRVKDMWTPENPDSKLPKFIIHESSSKKNYYRETSLLYTKGDYLSVRELTLSYLFPKSIISKLKLSSVRVNITGQNLAYFTRFKGTNPEAGGTEFAMYPLPRTIIFGLQASY